jgi:hypothetical protein
MTLVNQDYSGEAGGADSSIKSLDVRVDLPDTRLMYAFSQDLKRPSPVILYRRRVANVVEKDMHAQRLGPTHTGLSN